MESYKQQNKVASLVISDPFFAGNNRKRPCRKWDLVIIARSNMEAREMCHMMGFRIMGGAKLMRLVQD